LSLASVFGGATTAAGTKPLVVGRVEVATDDVDDLLGEPGAGLAAMQRVSRPVKELCILDPRGGSGMLTAAAVASLCTQRPPPHTLRPVIGWIPAVGRMHATRATS
jgi:hypothetical protein